MTMTTTPNKGGHGHCHYFLSNRLSTVVVAAQGLDEAVGCRLHVDEIAAQRAGAVEHKHDHRTLVFVDGLGVARRRELLPLRRGSQPIPFLHIVGADLVAAHVGEVLENKHVEDAFCRSGYGDA